MKNNRMAFSLRLDPEMYNKIKQGAEKNDITISDEARLLISQGLNKNAISKKHFDEENHKIIKLIKKNNHGFLYNIFHKN